MEAWTYDPANDIDKTLVERLKHFPREPDMLVYGMRTVAALVCRAWLRCYHRMSISGQEHLPAGESFIMVANHASHIDALCLLAALPLGKLHRAFPAAAQDYFFVNTPRLFFAAVVVNALPFQRKATPRQSLTLCRHLLETPGNTLILFPEGTRSADGEIGEFRGGIGMLVAGTNVPVLPCYLDGAHRAWPKGTMIPRPRKVQLRIGAPRRYSHLQHGKESAMHITADLREAVLGLRAEMSVPQEIMS